MNELCLLLVGTGDGVLGKQINSLVSVGSTGKETSQQEIQKQTHSSGGDVENVQDAIPDRDYCIFLINVCDRIAAAFMSPQWMSRYCNPPPGLEYFSLSSLKTLYKGKALQREGERMAQTQINSQNPNHFNSCSVICCGHFREHLKMFGLVCVLFSIKADVEHDR